MQSIIRGFIALIVCISLQNYFGGPSAAFAQSSALLGPGVTINYSFPNATTVQKLINCFNAGACTHMAPTNVGFYPAMCDNGNLCAGCYQWVNGSYQRVGDLDAAGGCSAAPAAHMRVATLYRMSCPAGAAGADCTNGKLFLTCRVDSLPNASGAAVASYSGECFGGNLFSVSASTTSQWDNGSNGGTDTSCQDAQVSVVALTRPSVLDISGSVGVTLSGAHPTNPQFNVVPTGGLTPLSSSTPSQFDFPLSSGQKIDFAVTYRSTNDLTCTALVGYTMPSRPVCPPGFQPSSLADAADSVCTACPGILTKTNTANTFNVTYKSTFANEACRTCSPGSAVIFNTSIPATTVAQCATTCVGPNQFNESWVHAFDSLNDPYREYVPGSTTPWAGGAPGYDFNVLDPGLCSDVATTWGQSYTGSQYGQGGASSYLVSEPTSLSASPACNSTDAVLNAAGILPPSGHEVALVRTTGVGGQEVDLTSLFPTCRATLARKILDHQQSSAVGVEVGVRSCTRMVGATSHNFAIVWLPNGCPESATAAQKCSFSESGDKHPFKSSNTIDYYQPTGVSCL